MYQIQCEVRPGYWEDYQEPIQSEADANMCLSLVQELYPMFNFRLKP